METFGILLLFKIYSKPAVMLYYDFAIYYTYKSYIGISGAKLLKPGRSFIDLHEEYSQLHSLFIINLY